MATIGNGPVQTSLPACRGKEGSSCTATYGGITYTGLCLGGVCQPMNGVGGSPPVHTSQCAGKKAGSPCQGRDGVTGLAYRGQCAGGRCVPITQGGGPAPTNIIVPKKWKQALTITGDVLGILVFVPVVIVLGMLLTGAGGFPPYGLVVASLVLVVVKVALDIINLSIEAKDIAALVKANKDGY